MRKLLYTANDPVLTILRLAVGMMLFAHGAQLMVGWFGGSGWNASIGSFTGMGIPRAWAALAIITQFLGSIGLLVGLLGRVAAFGSACVMAVAIAKVHAPVGFFMNWHGTQRGEGYEFHILALALLFAVVVRGSGALSLDRLLSRLLRPANTVPFPRAA